MHKSFRDKISKLLNKRFDSRSVWDNKYIKTKIKIYNNKMDKNFHRNKIPEDNEYCDYLSVTLLNSVIIVDKMYYPQIFLKECRYAVKRKR